MLKKKKKIFVASGKNPKFNEAIAPGKNPKNNKHTPTFIPDSRVS